MAEVTKVVGKMQLDTEGGSVKMQLGTEGGLVQVSYETRDKLVGSFTGEIGVAKHELGNEEVTSRFGVTKAMLPKIGVTKAELPKIGVTKTGLLNEEASGSSTPEIGVVTKAAVGSSTPKIRAPRSIPTRAAAASSTPEIGVVTSAAAGGSTPEIGVVTKAAAGGSTPEIGVVTKAAAGGSTPEIGVVTKAAAGSSSRKIGVVTKAAAGRSSRKIGVTKAPEIDVTKAVAVSRNPAIAIALARASLEKMAASGEMGLTKAMLNKYMRKVPAGSVMPEEVRKAEAVVVPVTKERVPDADIEMMKRHPLQKTRPLEDCIGARNPKVREMYLASKARIDNLVDLEQDCLRQYKEKGYAEIGVDYTGAFKKVFILPNPEVQVEGK